MKTGSCAIVAFAALILPVAAHADNPNDPAMRSKAARARDSAIIRQLNLNEAARVKQRDAQYAQGWRAWREAQDGQGRDTRADYAEQDSRYRADQADYEERRAQYEQDMGDWRRAVAACRAGDWSACD
ncbi:hypothetical protein [Novosphingobium olei]|uniref:Uncharacterized protein n=1 Tax=Novosphingobium olei TaxID=2728851 RepID=A0A7Y0G9Y6_9SPHN|nr:hypothetical protein [Novosphingobium olei]NML93324.1 hypothetical protein [Novosphingobium olei]BEU99884.1 hypothetical protein NSDW_09790 [Novosphingobium olei]